MFGKEGRSGKQERSEEEENLLSISAGVCQQQEDDD